MSYFTAVSSSMPTVYFRMHSTGSVIPNEGDPTIVTNIGIVVNTANTMSMGAATYSNQSYCPFVPFSSSLMQHYYYNGSVYTCTATSSATASLFNAINQYPSGSTGSGLTIEFLARLGYESAYSNSSYIMYYGNSANNQGWLVSDKAGVACGNISFQMYWVSGTTAQNLEVRWGSNATVDTPYTVAPPRPGLEWSQPPYPSGTGGPHNAWHHYVITWTSQIPGSNAGAFTLWVDGSPYEIDYAAGTNPPPSGAFNVFSNQQLWVGGSALGQYTYQNIAEVAIYPRVLDPAEIEEHWAQLGASWYSTNLSATLISGTSPHILYSVQAPAGNINYVPTASGSSGDPRSTKTNPGAN